MSKVLDLVSSYEYYRRRLSYNSFHSIWIDNRALGQLGHLPKVKGLGYYGYSSFIHIYRAVGHVDWAWSIPIM